MRRSGTRWLLFADAALALALLGPTPGCVSAGSYDAVADERDTLREDKERLEEASQGADQARVAALDQAEDLREERNRLALEVKKLGKRVSELELALKEQELALATRTEVARADDARFAPVRTELEPEVGAGQARLMLRPEGLQLVLAESLLFAPGSAELSAGGRMLLQRLALRVRDDDQRVEVEAGADPPALRQARGAAILRALAQAGVPNEQLRAGSFPREDPSEEEALPPRIGADIRLLPNLGAGAGGVSAPPPAPTASGASATARP